MTVRGKTHAGVELLGCFGCVTWMGLVAALAPSVTSSSLILVAARLLPKE